ncbi:MAG: FG-GAP repeat domain-containing protein, partial [Flavobacteriales bacterium]
VSGQATRLYFSNNGSSFTDVTTTNASGLDDALKPRSAIAVDLNNDGNLDFVVNAELRIEVWINNGSSSSPSYSFGNATQQPNQTVLNFPGFNSEGIASIDYDNDGDQDLVIDNNQFGVDILANNGSGSFTQVSNATTGLPTGGITGDYLTTGDVNNDGFVDILLRRQQEADLYFNDGDGTFTADSYNQVAANLNKGAVTISDFDTDGDLDLFWTDAGTNQIWTNTGGTISASNQPGTSSGVNLTSATIDSETHGDIDLDGDLDIYLANVSGAGFLFRANGNLSYTQPSSPLNLGIDPNGNANAAAFVDFDNDGDLDLYLGIDDAENQLWVNNLNSPNYVKVRAKWDLSGGIHSPAIGATAELLDCEGNRVSPLLNYAGGEGLGSSGNSVFHFAVTNPNQKYFVRVSYPFRNGVRKIVVKEVIPSSAADHTFDVLNTDSDSPFECLVFAPVATNDNGSTNEDNSVVLANITANDIATFSPLDLASIDLDPATAGIQSTINTIAGAWSVNTANGNLTFVPAANFNG